MALVNIGENRHELSAYVQRYENELIDNVIPFWETHCVDQEYGGYFTSLDRDGSVYDTEKYMWDAMAHRLHVRDILYESLPPGTLVGNREAGI